MFEVLGCVSWVGDRKGLDDKASPGKSEKSRWICRDCGCLRQLVTGLMWSIVGKGLKYQWSGLVGGWLVRLCFLESWTCLCLVELAGSVCLLVSHRYFWFSLWGEYEPGRTGQAGCRNVGRGWITLVGETEISKGWSPWDGYVDVVVVVGKTACCGEATQPSWRKLVWC